MGNDIPKGGKRHRRGSVFEMTPAERDAFLAGRRRQQLEEAAARHALRERIADLEAEVARLTGATKRTIAERNDYWNLAEKRRFENEALTDHVAALRAPLSFYVEADKAKRTLMDDRGRPEDKNFDEARRALRETVSGAEKHAEQVAALRKALEETCAWIERVACEVDEEHGVVIPGCIAQCQVIGMTLDATKETTA